MSLCIVSKFNWHKKDWWLPHTPNCNSVLHVESPGDEGVGCVPCPCNAGVKVGTHLEAFVHLAIQWHSWGLEKLIVCSTLILGGDQEFVLSFYVPVTKKTYSLLTHHLKIIINQLYKTETTTITTTTITTTTTTTSLYPPREVTVHKLQQGVECGWKRREGKGSCKHSHIGTKHHQGE